MLPDKEESKIQEDSDTTPAPDESPAGAEDEVMPAPSQAEAPRSLEDDIQRLKLELDACKDLYLRKAAEFENFKKRKQQEYLTIISSAEESLISDLLPVVDDFERLLANAQKEEFNQESFLRGVQLIRDKMMEALAARGVKPIEAVGNPFDPLLHEALLQQAESGVESGLILQEHLRGYRLRDKIIRHAQVVVSA